MVRTQAVKGNPFDHDQASGRGLSHHFVVESALENPGGIDSVPIQEVFRPGASDALGSGRDFRPSHVDPRGLQDLPDRLTHTLQIERRCNLGTG